MGIRKIMINLPKVTEVALHLRTKTRQVVRMLGVTAVPKIVTDNNNNNLGRNSGFRQLNQLKYLPKTLRETIETENAMQ